MTLSRDEFYEMMNLNPEKLAEFEDKYKTEYRVFRSIHETEASISGYFTIGKAYVNHSGEVCWFKTYLHKDENGFSHTRAATQDIRTWACAESDDRQAELDNFKKEMNKLMEAFNKEPVYVMDYVKGGKHYNLALEWHIDDNACLYYPLDKKIVEQSIPESIY